MAINIKESHEGLFTRKAKRAGMTVPEFAAHVLSHKGDYDEETIKQANFARNSRKWNHK
jgi:hypothetical protein